MPSAFSSPSRSPPRQRHGLPPPPRHRRTLSSTLVEESVAAAAALVKKWHPDAAPSCSLFLQGDGDDGSEEAQGFLRAAGELHRAMLFFAADTTIPSSQSGHGLVQAQALLQTAMHRLQLELHFLLDKHKHKHDDDVRAVAKAMMAAGYGKECISTFKSHRRTALAAKLQRLLGFPSPPSSLCLMIQKQATWEQIDGRIIPSWIAAATVAFNSLFTSEKDLCDAVFSGDVREAVFAAVANDQATGLLAVAEAAVARARRAPERLFRVLDVHDALTGALPALLSVFGESSEVAARAAVVVTKVAESARATLGGFEAAIHKDKAAATMAGGAVHPLTRYVMNYLVFLADYQDGLALIYDDDDDTSSSSMSSSTTLHNSNNRPTIPMIQRLVSVLVGKLEAKAGSYRDMALGYLFLANNTKYIAGKVAGSARLRRVLGGEDDWAAAQAAKAMAHVDVFVRAAWGKVMSAIAASGSAPPQDVEAAVLEAVGAQDQWVAADDDMGAALRAAATAAVVPKYRMFYRRHGAAVRLTPGDVVTMIAALFGGTGTISITSSAPLTFMQPQQQQRCTEVAEPMQRRLEDPNSNANPTRRPQQLFA